SRSSRGRGGRPSPSRRPPWGRSMARDLPPTRSSGRPSARGPLPHCLDGLRPSATAFGLWLGGGGVGATDSLAPSGDSWAALGYFFHWTGRNFFSTHRSSGGISLITSVSTRDWAAAFRAGSLNTPSSTSGARSRPPTRPPDAP